MGTGLGSPRLGSELGAAGGGGGAGISRNSSKGGGGAEADKNRRGAVSGDAGDPRALGRSESSFKPPRDGFSRIRSARTSRRLG